MPKFTQRDAGYGRVRQVKRAARLYPNRVQYDLRSAARRLHLHVIACQVEFYNPLATGKNGKGAGAPQWVDVIARHSDLGLLALDIEADVGAAKPRFAAEKKAALALRGIPYLCQPPAGLWMLEANIAVWIRQLTLSSKEKT